MTDNKHTPGPWMAAAKPSSIVGWPVVQTGVGRSICNVTYVQHSAIDPGVTGDRAFNSESKANARLIAAAPDLLAALKNILPYAELFIKPLDDELGMDRLRAAVTAIRKAEGGAG